MFLPCLAKPDFLGDKRSILTEIGILFLWGKFQTYFQTLNGNPQLSGRNCKPDKRKVYFLISKIVAALPIASGKDEEASGC